jgi:hypothetical protein
MNFGSYGFKIKKSIGEKLLISIKSPFLITVHKKGVST